MKLFYELFTVKLNAVVYYKYRSIQLYIPVIQYLFTDDAQHLLIHD